MSLKVTSKGATILGIFLPVTQYGGSDGNIHTLGTLGSNGVIFFVVGPGPRGTVSDRAARDPGSYNPDTHFGGALTGIGIVGARIGGPVPHGGLLPQQWGTFTEKKMMRGMIR